MFSGRGASNDNIRCMPTMRRTDCLPLPKRDEVHVWLAFLSEALPVLPLLAGLLSIGELQRASRFLLSADRSRYVAAHGILRQLLGRYLMAPPQELAFIHNAYGKPALAGREGQPVLSFNLAHSGGVILCAFTDGDRRVGVDVESIRPGLAFLELAQNQFSAREIRDLLALNESEQLAAFFRCWTRKEACVKARGEGLSFPLQQFTVSFANDAPPDVQWAESDPLKALDWSMFDITVGAGYAGALVIEGRPAGLLSRRWRASD